MKRLFLLLPLMALAGCKDPQDGVKVTVSYSGFVPACVRVTARNGDSDDTRTTEVAVRGTDIAGKGQVVVGVRVPDGWGPILKVKAEGLEQAKDATACGGKVVTEHSGGIEIQKGSADKGTPHELALDLTATDTDGDGYASPRADGTGGSDCNDDNIAINPSAAELCNGEDDNCDGNRDEGLGLGDACTGANSCTGIKACGPNDAVVCNSPPQVEAWEDEDEDGVGALNKPSVLTCPVDGKLPSNRLPLTAAHNDCDDKNPTVKPGMPELCNGIDDNCVDNIDEGYHVGDTCTEATSLCSGKLKCASLTTTSCEVTGTVPTWYPDNDLDSYGTAAGAVASCPKPNSGAVDFADKAGDCDDGNPFTHPTATELCDGQDNNCNQVPDDGANCALGTPAWASRTVVDAGTDLFDVSVYNDGGVWVVGQFSTRAVKKPQSTTFIVKDDKCTSSTENLPLQSVWANPTTGTAYIGRANSGLIVQTPDSANCDANTRTNLNQSDFGIGGVIGFASANGVQVHGAGNKFDTTGGLFDWNGSTTGAVPVIQNEGTPLLAIHGKTSNLMFAVGNEVIAGPPASTRAAIYRRAPGSTTWSVEANVPNVPALNDVHVVNEKLAFAVGADRTLLKWDGSTWTKIEGLPPARVTDPPKAENYTGVLAFGASSIYIVTESGRIYRFNGLGWQQEFEGTSLYGIDGTSPEDIWVVGRFGNALHYPFWPQ